MVFERGDDINQEIYNFKIVHGTGGISLLRIKNFNYVPTVSNNIRIIMITNMPNHGGAEYNRQYINNPDKKNITLITLDKPHFKCGQDLIYPICEIIDDIKEDYVLYMDYTDTALISDIIDPTEILNFYKCKILFVAEDGYSYPDHHCVDREYLSIYQKYHNNADANQYYGESMLNTQKRNLDRLRKRIPSCPYYRSLNSGVFLGERLYVKEKLCEMVELMESDPTLGYPYGAKENQILWQYLMSLDNNIEIDFLDKFFLWPCYPKIGNDPSHWEHFNFFNKLVDKINDLE